MAAVHPLLRHATEATTILLAPFSRWAAHRPLRCVLRVVSSGKHHVFTLFHIPSFHRRRPTVKRCFARYLSLSSLSRHTRQMCGLSFGLVSTVVNSVCPCGHHHTVAWSIPLCWSFLDDSKHARAQWTLQCEVVTQRPHTYRLLQMSRKNLFYQVQSLYAYFPVPPSPTTVRISINRASHVIQRLISTPHTAWRRARSTQRRTTRVRGGGAVPSACRWPD